MKLKLQKCHSLKKWKNDSYVQDMLYIQLYYPHVQQSICTLYWNITSSSTINSIRHLGVCNIDLQVSTLYVHMYTKLMSHENSKRSLNCFDNVNFDYENSK